jgi:hypothetical protein
MWFDMVNIDSLPLQGGSLKFFQYKQSFSHLEGPMHPLRRAASVALDGLTLIVYVKSLHESERKSRDFRSPQTRARGSACMEFHAGKSGDRRVAYTPRAARIFVSIIFGLRSCSWYTVLDVADRRARAKRSVRKDHVASKGEHRMNSAADGF